MYALLLVFTFGSTAPLFAAEPPQAPSAQRTAPSKTGEKEQPTQDVLNFDSDIIEGQRKAPELFLHTEVQKPSLDSILFQRMDFNDFHVVDAIKHPRMAEPPKGGPR